MKKIEISTASRPLSDYADEIGDDILVLTENDQPVAAIVSLRNVDREAWALSTDATFIEIIDRARAEFAAGGKLSFDEMKRALLP